MRWAPLLLGVVPCAALAQGVASEGSRPEEPPAGQLTKPPELVHYVEAVYPPDAHQERRTGEVVLLVDIDEQGAVANVQIASSAGHGFDEAAIAAAREFRFSPAEVDGNPAPVRITYKYGFTLAPEPTPAAVKTARESAVNFRGRAIERGTRKPLAGIEVVIDEGAATAITDSEARFEFKDLPLGKHKVLINIPSYVRFDTEEEIVEGKVTEATYYVRRRTYTPYETLIRGEKERKEVARIVMQQEEIRLIPGTQGDALRVVQNLPGVARAPYGIGVLLVRGGRDWDTRVYLDGTYIPLLFHFGGLTSTFNADLLENITFLPGNFGVRNGRSTGGTVEANVRQPSADLYHGYADVNLIHAGALVEGPVADGVSFALSARRSYVDLILGLVLPPELGVALIVAPRYWDYQGVLSIAKKGSADRYLVSVFGSSDAFRFLLPNPALVDPEGRSDLTFGIEYHRLAGTWDHQFSERLSSRTHLALGLTGLNNSFGPDVFLKILFESIQVREEVNFDLSERLTLSAGLDIMATHYGYEASGPPIPRPDEVPPPFLSRQTIYDRESSFAALPAAFLEAVWRITPSFKLIPGIRVDFDTYARDGWVDPRLVGFWQLFERTLLKGGLGLFQQPPDFRFGQSTRTFGNPDLKHESALHAMLGVEQRLTDAISLDAQLYFKWMYNLVTQSTAVVVRDGQETLERYANRAFGRSYGAEILLRHELTSRFFGWIAYSISRSERRDIYSKDWRLFSLDQTQNLIAVVSYKFPYDWIAGVRLRYATGNPFSRIERGVLDADLQRYFPIIPDQIFTERVPDFFQIDVRIDKRFVFEKWMFTVYLDVQNVTNRANPEATTYNYDYTKHAFLSGLPIFPSLGLKGEF